MKLRTAYFCKECDEEVKPEELRFLCPKCGYKRDVYDGALYYQWKVEVTPPFKKCPSTEEASELISELFKEGASCPIDLMDKLSGFEKPEEKDESIKTISKKGRRVSDR